MVFKLIPKSNYMRMVYYKLDENSKQIKGYFHQWGTDFITDNKDNPISVTRAIVEDLKTKAIHLVYPEFIEFLD